MNTITTFFAIIVNVAVCISSFLIVQKVIHITENKLKNKKQDFLDPAFKEFQKLTDYIAEQTNIYFHGPHTQPSPFVQLLNTMHNNVVEPIAITDTQNNAEGNNMVLNLDFAPWEEVIVQIPQYEHAVLENSGGVSMSVHAASTCKGDRCTIHKRTDHPLRKFEQVYSFKFKLMLRYCDHKLFHPDPDDIRWINGESNYLHNCQCGCCVGKKAIEEIVRYA